MVQSVPVLKLQMLILDCGQRLADEVFPAMGKINFMEAGQSIAISKGKANNRVISGAHWDENGTYKTYAGARDFDE
jgi:hypothetical protein